MRIFLQTLCVASLAAIATAGSQSRSPFAKDHDQRDFTVLEHKATGTKLSIVKNSGLCETTPGVNSYSGYLSTGEDMNMWFWFFESRNSPATAPLSLWLTGGPACSSMMGLFQEVGPCLMLNGAEEPSLNPYSWNNNANMLFVDQPVGTGFSYGVDNVNSSAATAPAMWKFMQAFYDLFPEYQSRDFGLFTESYGGHMGPEIFSYFEDQNAAVASGSAEGEKINMIALGINNGWMDAVIQYKSFLDFSLQNSYAKLLTQSQYDEALHNYTTQCLPAAAKCPGTSGTAEDCLAADEICSTVTQFAVEGINNYSFSRYDIRNSGDSAFDKTYWNFLQNATVLAAIGAQKEYEECPDDPYFKIINTGDKFRSALPALSKVAQAGVNVLIWTGDADWSCNWVGNLAVAEAIEYDGQAQFAAKAVTPYKVNGTTHGEYKTVGNMNWLRVFEAGHGMPSYQPETALQAFVQLMQKQPLASTSSCKDRSRMRA